MKAVYTESSIHAAAADGATLSQQAARVWFCTLPLAGGASHAGVDTELHSEVKQGLGLCLSGVI